MNDSAKHCAEHAPMNRECSECKKAYRRWHYQQNKAEYKEKHAAWYQKNKDAHNERQFSRYVKDTFNLTTTEYKDFISKNPYCHICGVSFKATKACLDHDHFTGHVRGVLCSRCNMALGLLDDLPVRLQQAKEYLEKHTLDD